MRVLWTLSGVVMMVGEMGLNLGAFRRGGMWAGDVHSLRHEKGAAGSDVVKGGTRLCKMKEVNCDRYVSYNAIVQNCSVSLIFGPIGVDPESHTVPDTCQHHRKYTVINEPNRYGSHAAQALVLYSATLRLEGKTITGTTDSEHGMLFLLLSFRWSLHEAILSAEGPWLGTLEYHSTKPK